MQNSKKELIGSQTLQQSYPLSTDETKESKESQAGATQLLVLSQTTDNLQHGALQGVAPPVPTIQTTDQPDYRLQYRKPIPEEKAQTYAKTAKKLPQKPSELNGKPKESVRKPPPSAPSRLEHEGKPRTNSRRPVIRGSKTVQGKQLGAVRYADLFIGGCNKDVVVDDIKNYCTNSLKVDVIECTPLVTKSARFNSFKLTLDYESREKLLSGEFWPNRVVVRKFTQPRSASSNSIYFDKTNNDVGLYSQNNQKHA